MLERVWRKRNPPTPLVRVQICVATMENSTEVPKNLKIELPYDLWGNFDEMRYGRSEKTTVTFTLTLIIHVLLELAFTYVS